MTSEWYYTTNKQQMGPVSWDELRELAEVGILKPHDMVWSEGMDEWVKAINQDGLFGERGGGKASQKAAYTESKPPPGRRTRRREEEEEDDQDDEEDRKESKRKNRERQQERAKMAVGVKIGLIIAGVLVVLVLGTGCIGGLLWITFGGFGGGGGPGRQTYTVSNMRQRTTNDRNFRFTQGKRVIITVTTANLQFANTDVDLHVIRRGQIVALDERIPPQTRDCRVEFVVPATDSYTVQVRNLGPGNAGRCDVVVEER